MSLTGSSEVDTETCPVCGCAVDPDLAFGGMHPSCEAANHRRNQAGDRL